MYKHHEFRSRDKKLLGPHILPEETVLSGRLQFALFVDPDSNQKALRPCRMDEADETLLSSEIRRQTRGRLIFLPTYFRPWVGTSGRLKTGSAGTNHQPPPCPNHVNPTAAKPPLPVSRNCGSKQKRWANVVGNRWFRNS